MGKLTELYIERDKIKKRYNLSKKKSSKHKQYEKLMGIEKEIECYIHNPLS